MSRYVYFFHFFYFLLSFFLLVSFFFVFFSFVFFFFFFQAEDGIRDLTVTGVQTCALPILPRHQRAEVRARRLPRSFVEARRGDARTGGRDRIGAPQFPRTSARRSEEGRRSEERRVGKECRSRGSPYHEKKKKREQEAG